MKVIRTIVADPPWQLNDRLPGSTRGAAKNYRVMSIDEITENMRATFALARLDFDCFLLLWRLSSFQIEALNVITALGFTTKCELVWAKKTRYGKRWFGMGRYTRAEHETCLVATRGRPKVLNRHTRSIFEGAVRAHSEKPEEFYALVENTFPGAYLELYARTSRKGWYQAGDELGALDGRVCA